MRTVSRDRQYLVTKDNALALQGFKWSLGMGVEAASPAPRSLANLLMEALQCCAFEPR